MMWKIVPFFVALFVVGLGSLPHGDVQIVKPRDVDFERALRYAIYVHNRDSSKKNIYAMDELMEVKIEIEDDSVTYTITTKLGKTYCTKQYKYRFCHIIKETAFAEYMLCVFKVKVLKQDGIKLEQYGCNKIVSNGYG